MGLKRIQCVSDVMAQWGEFSCLQAGFVQAQKWMLPSPWSPHSWSCMMGLMGIELLSLSSWSIVIYIIILLTSWHILNVPDASISPCCITHTASSASSSFPGHKVPYFMRSKFSSSEKPSVVCFLYFILKMESSLENFTEKQKLDISKTMSMNN